MVLGHSALRLPPKPTSIPPGSKSSTTDPVLGDETGPRRSLDERRVPGSPYWANPACAGDVLPYWANPACPAYWANPACPGDLMNPACPGDWPNPACPGDWMNEGA